MNIELKAKYRTSRPTQGYPAKPRTGNSHGPTKDKMPASVPCKRATAGAKTFGTEKHEARKRVMLVNALTGQRRMEDLADQ